MRNSKILKAAFIIVITGSMFVSCNNNDEPFKIYTDMLVINKKMDNVVKRAPAYYAYGNQSLESASVLLPGGSETLTLESHPASSYTFVKEPEAVDFKEVSPAEGDYKFTVKAKTGEVIVMTDAFDFTGLAIPQITKDTFSGSPASLLVEWAAVTGTDGYFVKLLDTDEKPVFSGYVVGPGTLKYTISGTSASGAWTVLPVEGTNYILQVNAILFDAEATGSDSEYNVSEISIGEKTIIWGNN